MCTVCGEGEMTLETSALFWLRISVVHTLWSEGYVYNVQKLYPIPLSYVGVCRMCP